MPVEPLPCGSGDGGGDPGVDVEGTLLCDVNAAGDVVGVALVEAVYNELGVRTGTRLVDPATGDPYVAQGTIQACREGCCPEPVILCDVQPDGSTVQFIRAFTGDEAGNLDVKDTLFDGAVYVPTGTVSDCNPYSTCTPDSSTDLAGTCGPGEPVEQPILQAEGVLADAVIEDDPAADDLCGGGTWNTAPAPIAGFPIDESFANDTFDTGNANWTLQGTPLAHLTSGVEDPSGAGALRLSNQNFATNGAAILNTPFSNADNVTTEVDWASYGGTDPGGDGWMQFFSDGSQPAQDNALGGGGSLGLGNIDYGYLAIVLDEFGGSGPPGGFNFNRLKLFCLDNVATPPMTSPQQIFDVALAPRTVNNHPRTNAPRLRTSIITEGGITYVSVAIDWKDGNGFQSYLNRFDINAAGCPAAPATLRTGFSASSGGAFQSIHELMDARIVAGGLEAWRSLPLVTDPVPACATQVSVNVCVDVTFVSDNQDAGNGEPEAWLWLVNSATNTVLDRAQVSSVPAQVGQANNLCVDTLVTPAALADLRIYVGADRRDAGGVYETLWENLEITATALGCPATPQRTLAISAPCPIDVNIVSGGGGDGGDGGGNVVVNSAPSFEDAVICYQTQDDPTFRSGFRREVRAADGTVTISFLGDNGAAVTPTLWRAGSCIEDTEVIQLCDDGTNPPTPYLRRITFNLAGFPSSSGDIDYFGLPYIPVGEGVLCQPEDDPGRDVEQATLCDDNGPFIRRYEYNDQSGLPSGVPTDYTLAGAPYVAVGTVVACGGSGGSVAEFILCDDVGTFIRKFIQDDEGAVTAIVDLTLAGAPYVPTGTVTRCESADTEFTTVCDAGSSTTLLVRYAFDSVGLVTDTLYYNLDGTGPVAPVGPISEGGCCTPFSLGESCYDAGGGDIRRVMGERRCRPDGTPGFDLYFYDTQSGDLVPTPAFVDCPGPDDISRDTEQIVLCDNNGPFIRAYQWGADTGTPSGAPADYTLAGLPYVPVGPVVNCGASSTARDEELLVLCDSTPTRFLRRYNYDAATGALIGIVNTTLDGSTPFVPVGAVGVCTTAIASDFDFVVQSLCDSNGTAFFRRLTFNSATGAVTSTTDTTLAGAAFVPVGAVGLCSNCCPVVLGSGCTNVGSGFYTAIRATNGTISLIDSVTGAAVLAANIVPCPSDSTVRTLTAQARQLTNATPWTPGGDVVGTLTSLTVTGLSGLWDMVDANGTVLTGLPAGLNLTWSAEDDNTLTGPQSVTPQAGASVVANWTQR